MKSREMKFGKRRVVDFYGFKNKNDFKIVCEPHVLRKKLDQVSLPDVVHKVLTVDDFSLDKKYEGLIDDFDQEVYMTVKKDTANRLAKYTADFAYGVDGQTIIFTDHVGSAKRIAEELEAALIHGGVSSGERKRQLQEFKKGEYKYLVATYKTAGTGLNLTNANYMIFNDLPFVPADIEQARGRIHRIGQKQTCFYYYVGMSEMYFKLFKNLKYKSDILKDLI